MVLHKTRPKNDRHKIDEGSLFVLLLSIPHGSAFGQKKLCCPLSVQWRRAC